MSIKHANAYKVCLADKAFTINDGISVIVVVRQLFFRTQFTINANASFRENIVGALKLNRLTSNLNVNLITQHLHTYACLSITYYFT